jgi:hypothetical protein
MSSGGGISIFSLRALTGIDRKNPSVQINFNNEGEEFRRVNQGYERLSSEFYACLGRI